MKKPLIITGGISCEKVPKRIYFTIFSSFFIILIIVKILRIGPVIFVVNKSRGWGVHTGDFLAFIPFTLGVLWPIFWLKHHRKESDSG